MSLKNSKIRIIKKMNFRSVGRFGTQGGKSVPISYKEKKNTR